MLLSDQLVMYQHSGACQLFQFMFTSNNNGQFLMYQLDSSNSLSFSIHQSVLNVKPEVKEETEEEKEHKHKTFVEKYEKQIKHFGECVQPIDPGYGTVCM